MKTSLLAILVALPLLFVAATASAATGCCADEACCENCKDC